MVQYIKQICGFVKYTKGYANMYRRLLSLLLVACMIIPMICMLPLPLLAAADVNAPVYSTSFPGADNANLPTLQSDEVGS